MLIAICYRTRTQSWGNQMRWLAIVGVSMLGWAGAAWADIGDPCPNGDECGPTELCYPDEVEDYCTTRCPAAGCPDGFFCRGENGVNICVNDPPPMQTEAAMGEACGPDVEGRCAQGLFCVADGEGGYCSRGCFGVGSCPDGYRCTAAGDRACARLTGLPGPLAPCAPEGVCADGLDCVEVPTHQRPICALPCNLPEEGEEQDSPICPPDQMCMNDASCVPAMGPTQPGLGDRCRDDAAEPTLQGCADGLVCHLVSGLDSYCTQGACDLSTACPDGYGCIEIEPGVGACRRGVPDDAVFDGGNVQMPPPGGMGGMGGMPGGMPGVGGMPGAGGAGAGVVEPPPPAGEGGAGGSAASGGDEGGCTQSHGRGSAPGLAVILAGLVLRRRRR